MCTNYLFDKCNRCHVIDTVVQLHMIVGLGIRLKSLSVKSWMWASLRLPRNSHIAAKVLLKKANLSFILSHMYVMTDAYGSLCFSAIFSASLLLTLLHSRAIPLVVVKTRGLNEDFSMSISAGFRGGDQGARDQGPQPKRAPHHVHVFSHILVRHVRAT